MPAIGIVLVLTALFFGATAFAEPKKEKKKPQENPKPPPPKEDKPKSPAGEVGGLIGGVIGLGGKLGALGGMFKGVGDALASFATAFPPGLGPLIVAVAAYILIRELTMLGEKSKDFSQKIGRAAYPPFGVLHSMEVAFMREVFKGGKDFPPCTVAETISRDERLDISFTQIKTVGEFVSMAKPDDWSVAQWKEFNKLVRHICLQSLAFQSYIATAFNSNWKGISGLGRKHFASIAELGFHGAPVARWDDVDLTQSIPYDSIPTPGGFYFDLSGGLNALSIPHDGGLLAKASLDGIVAATLLLRSDPTFWLIYEPPVYAKQKFDWGNYSRVGASFVNGKAHFAAGSYASETPFTINLAREDAGLVYGWNGNISAEGLFSDVETQGAETERIWKELNAAGDAARAQAESEARAQDAARQAANSAAHMEEVANDAIAATSNPDVQPTRIEESPSANQWGAVLGTSQPRNLR